MRNTVEPFRVHVRRQNHQDAVVVLRFEVKEGMGVLGLRVVGRDDPAPSIHFEEQEITPDTLRAGRFVHVLQSGQRQSYALSRVTQEISSRLPFDAWATLVPVSEYGFRYLVVDEETLLSPVGTAQVAAASVPPQSQGAPAGADLRPPGVTAPRPKAVARAVSSNPPRVDNRAHASVPPRQTPVAPALAESALRGLNQNQVLELLKQEMAKVEALHNHLADIDRQLRASQGREQDLLEVMKRWQTRG